MSQGANRPRGPVVVFAGFLLLLVNSGYLAASAEPTLFYMAYVLFHVVGFCTLIIPLVLYGTRLLRACRGLGETLRTILAHAGFWAMATSMTVGVILMVIGNFTP